MLADASVSSHLTGVGVSAIAGPPVPLLLVGPIVTVLVSMVTFTLLPVITQLCSQRGAQCLSVNVQCAAYWSTWTQRGLVMVGFSSC